MTTSKKIIKDSIKFLKVLLNKHSSTLTKIKEETNLSDEEYPHVEKYLFGNDYITGAESEITVTSKGIDFLEEQKLWNKFIKFIRDSNAFLGFVFMLIQLIIFVITIYLIYNK